MAKKFYIETVGCQMNTLDSELAAATLASAGYVRSKTARGADILLFNTCSVRSHAEEKIYSALGRLKHWKERHSDGAIGVMGCMAQKDRETIFRRAPHVELVVGPGQIDRLPELLERLARGETPQTAVSRDRFRRDTTAQAVRESFRRYDPIRLSEYRPSRYQAMVRIMFGCDKFCSYCIVPKTRGPEQSRPAADIVREVETLARQGCREVTLLGQTVNNYRYKEGERTVALADLLERIDGIDGIARVRFVSSYPTAMTDELLGAVRDLPSAMPYLHVPAQHGADSVLKRMRRRYTSAFYRELVERIYETIPGAAITSDFIVGFCGETEEEFERTADLIRFARFKNSFIFKYSPREGTKSAEEYADDVPESVKRRRNNALLDVQTEVSTAESAKFVGRTVPILVEGPSKSALKTADAGLLPILGSAEPVNGGRTVQLTGRTPCDRIVVFDGPASLAGETVSVRVLSAAPFTLFGELVKCN